MMKSGVAGASKTTTTTTMSFMEGTLEAYNTRKKVLFVDFRGYRLVKTLGSGAYGTIYTAIDLNTGETVAVKRIKYNINIHIEIDILSSCHHPNIIGFRTSIIDYYLGDVFVVMEHASSDLRTYMENRDERLKEPTVKRLMFQLLRGVAYLHNMKIMHRDLKPDNLLMTDQQQLKICDFGLSKRFHVPYGASLELTRTVVSRWYRSPELLLGEMMYSTAIDIWSVGCIMAEMVINDVLFPGVSEIDQLNRIFSVMCTSDLEIIWSALLKGQEISYGDRLRSYVPESLLSDEGFDLLSRLLLMNSTMRINAINALRHPWFNDAWYNI